MMKLTDAIARIAKRARSRALRGRGGYEGSVCIGGYAGCGNLGDDAILQGYLEKRAADGTRGRVTVLAGHPRRSSRRFGVRCVGRKNPIAVLWALLSSESFLCGGGSLLQNATGDLSLYYYLALLRCAVLLGCRTSLLAGGIGPIEGARQQRHTARVLNACRTVEVRDAASHRFLSSIGVRRELLRLSPDPALFLPMPPSSRRAFLMSENGIGEEEAYLCAVLRPPAENATEAARVLGAALRTVARDRGLIPCLMVFAPKEDLAFSRAVAEKCDGRLIRLREATDALALLSGARFAVCMRLHALVLSRVADTCAIGISVDPRDQKIESFCRESAFLHLPLAEQSIVSLSAELGGIE